MSVLVSVSLLLFLLHHRVRVIVVFVVVIVVVIVDHVAIVVVMVGKTRWQTLAKQLDRPTSTKDKTKGRRRACAVPLDKIRVVAVPRMYLVCVMMNVSLGMPAKARK